MRVVIHGSFTISTPRPPPYLHINLPVPKATPCNPPTSDRFTLRFIRFYPTERLCKVVLRQYIPVKLGLSQVDSIRELLSKEFYDFGPNPVSESLYFRDFPVKITFATSYSDPLYPKPLESRVFIPPCLL